MDDVIRRPIGDPPATPNAAPSDDDGPASLAPPRDYRSDRSGSVRGGGADVCSLGSPQATVVVAQVRACGPSQALERAKPSAAGQGMRSETKRPERPKRVERRRFSSRWWHARRLEWRHPRQQPVAPLGGPREPVTRAEDASPTARQGVRKPPAASNGRGRSLFARPVQDARLRCHLAG